jgi:molecular chaperone GrpE
MQSSPASDDQAVEPAPEQQRFDQLEDRYKRALADLDNFRKRSAKETERRVTEARDGVLREWLEVVDSVERALQTSEDEALQTSEDEGLRALHDQMRGILERHRVVRVGERGDPFDPEIHEAVAVTETEEAPDGTVVEVARPGYRSGDRVLRPAQVVVARAPR